jgi:hypothetical protein
MTQHNRKGLLVASAGQGAAFRLPSPAVSGPRANPATKAALSRLRHVFITP